VRRRALVEAVTGVKCEPGTRDGVLAVVADRMFEAGTNSIPWNGRETSGPAVPSGTYLVRMEAAGLSESRKVTFVS
jgi:hypothetical protein